ncbi:hypothetical protein GMST_43330 [Geomonas silvestris]|uniref:Uncharacterized protein n=2 Tax=Geomonas silvestris TaxID=2740184 RepID=A0A6V8MPN2_9BACT|nr:hypothetical protein GMST_43330 [Geomonas silvestris]
MQNMGTVISFQERRDAATARTGLRSAIESRLSRNGHAPETICLKASEVMAIYDRYLAKDAVFNVELDSSLFGFLTEAQVQILSDEFSRHLNLVVQPLREAVGEAIQLKLEVLDLLRG